MLCQALMGRPKLILLDEPTNGIDDEGVKLIIDKLLTLKVQGSLIIIASHIKPDLTSLADELIHISDTQIIDTKLNHQKNP